MQKFLLFEEMKLQLLKDKCQLLLEDIQHPCRGAQPFCAMFAGEVQEFFS